MRLYEKLLFLAQLHQVVHFVGEKVRLLCLKDQREMSSSIFGGVKAHQKVIKQGRESLVMSGQSLPLNPL